LLRRILRAHPPAPHPLQRLFDALRPFFRAMLRVPLVVVGITLALAALGLSQASRLSIDTDLANLLPPDYPSVQALERLRATVGGETLLDVGIASPSFAANQAFAEALIPQAMALRGPGGGPLFARYDYRQDTTFLAANALYFATDVELDQLERLLREEAEAARLAANPFYFDLDDDLGLDDEEEGGAEGEELQASLQRLQPGEFFVSRDSTVLAVRFLPAGGQTDVGLTRSTYRQVDSLIAALDPASFHPEMEATAAGRLYRSIVEVDAIERDVQRSFGAGVLAVLLFVTGYFFYKAIQVRGTSRRVVLRELARLPLTAFLLGVPLLMSLAWTFGVAYVAFGTLNLMTSTLALVLFGLGIDYGIHFYARYAEERGRRQEVPDAAETAFVSTGQAVAVSALTTSVALFALTLADFRGFSEFGFIGGLGILFAVLAMLVVLPSLLVLAERVGALRLEAAPEVAPSARASGRFLAARPVLLASLLLMVVSVALLPFERFEYNFARLEPEPRAYLDRAERVWPAFEQGTGGRRNPAYVVLDTPEQAERVAEELRARAATDTTIADVESLAERFPMTPAAAERRIERIAEIRALTEDPFLQADTTGQIARVRRAASPTAPIPLADVPEDLRRPFTDREGEVGRFVVVYPRGELSEDARRSMAFAAAVSDIPLGDGTTVDGGSTSIVAAEMLRLMLAESPFMVALTFLVIALLMGLVFRSVLWAGLALLPLVVGVLWMLGGMVAAGLLFTFYNLVVLPAVLGIGNDCGVHLVHRYREEGPGSLRYVLRSTGEHVTVGALTTMIGFAGLLLSFHPGLRSIGQLAVLGIGTTLLAALFFLPALLQWREDRQQKQVPASEIS
jgi:uncharacterized protein